MVNKSRRNKQPYGQRRNTQNGLCAFRMLLFGARHGVTRTSTMMPRSKKRCDLFALSSVNVRLRLVFPNLILSNEVRNPLPPLSLIFLFASALYYSHRPHIDTVLARWDFPGSSFSPS